MVIIILTIILYRIKSVVYQKRMRFILVYKYGILQTKTERIDVNFCQNTTQLLEYLQKRVRQPSKSFIVTFKRAKITFRIISDWPLTHYGLKEGSQLHIELLQGQTQKQNKNMNINNRYLNNILGLNKVQNSQIEQVKQEQDENQEQQDKNFNVRKYLDSECQKMLKFIQQKNLQAFLDIFQDYPENIDQQSLLQIQKKKPFIIDQLGQKGWGALHYAIFCRANEIFQELIEMQIDVNKCTSDGWLPIQLAIDLKDSFFIEKLLNESGINLNLVTSRGSPLHFAAKKANKHILQMLLDKQIDVNIKDTSGKTALQVCLDPQCCELIKKCQQKKETYNEYIKGNLPLALTTIVKGEILKVKRPFMSLKQRYLLVDPFQGSLIRYECKNDYPKKPKQITPLCDLKEIHILEEEEKSWHMKKQLVYFVIQEPNKEIYACKFRKTAQKWVRNLKIAVKFAQQLQKNPQLISQIKKNELEILDIEQQIQQAPKKIKRNIFNMSMHSRQSTMSAKSYDPNSQQKNIVSGETSVPPQLTSNKTIEQKMPLKNSENNQNSNSTAKQRIQQNKKNMNNKKQQLANQLNEIADSKVSFSSFDILSTLGSGAFGKVFLAKHISTGKLYALKALKKKNLILQKQLKYAIIEANILKQASHHFIINLHFAFQTPHYLYLALDYCSGRDLSFHLAREVTFPEEEAKYYIAQLILAIEHLHQKKIIYRDLKPQNILLDGTGHIKLADFGLSKQTDDQKTKSFCGSPAYLSPEMLNQKGAGKQSDLYGIGAVLYEFIIGQPPYFSDDIPTLYKNIREGKLKFPKNVSQNAKNIISGLLQRDPKKRLGSKSMSQIKDHPFFSTINWQKLNKMEIKPPTRPDIQDSQHSDDDELNVIQNKKTTNFTDFDYDQSTKKINRLLNFSFVRAE